MSSQAPRRVSWPTAAHSRTTVGPWPPPRVPSPSCPSLSFPSSEPYRRRGARTRSARRPRFRPRLRCPALVWPRCSLPRRRRNCSAGSRCFAPSRGPCRHGPARSRSSRSAQFAPRPPDPAPARARGSKHPGLAYRLPSTTRYRPCGSRTCRTARRSTDPLHGSTPRLAPPTEY
jgi:hypothetical protein